MASHIAADFRFDSRGDTWDKSALMDRIEQALTRWDVSNCSLSQFEVTKDARGVRSSFQVTCRMSSMEASIPTFPSRWELGWHLTDDTCHITDIKPIRTQWMPYDRLDEVLRR